jgi:thioredoxin reductase
METTVKSIEPRTPSVKSQPIPVTIIGAGPYGLSIAAHLRALGVRFRIFGKAMESWSALMPKGMLLKSEGFASSLHDPDGYTLKSFCEGRGLPYGDIGFAIPVDVMVAYGCSFQERLVPDLEDRTVATVEPLQTGFLLHLEDGESFTTSRLIVAVGCRYFSYVPPVLAQLPSKLLSHSSQLHEMSQFQGRCVTVVGAGSSALDVSALLHEAGAEVQLLARRSSIVFNSTPGPRSLYDRIRYPMSQLGAGWKVRFYDSAPMLFRCLSPETRLGIIKRTLGPAGGWQMRQRVEGRVPMLLGCCVERAEVRDGRVHLSYRNEQGANSDVVTDHVVAATGYQVDCRRFSFLSEKIRSGLRTENLAPVLSQNFESSIPGLYFVGLSAATCFGPVMRFVAGTKYTAPHLAKHLSRVARH